MGNPYDYNLQGQGGGVVISNTGVVTGNFRWIQGITDFEITEILSSNISNVSFLQGYTIPAGVGIGGRFTSITLSSGTVIAYYA
jgi:hypothetical protein